MSVEGRQNGADVVWWRALSVFSSGQRLTSGRCNQRTAERLVEETVKRLKREGWREVSGRFHYRGQWVEVSVVKEEKGEE